MHYENTFLHGCFSNPYELAVTLFLQSVQHDDFAILFIADSLISVESVVCSFVCLFLKKVSLNF